jgi:hypothetical protein
LRPEGEKEVSHLDLGQVDRGLVNLRGRGEVGLEIAGQRLARKVSLLEEFELWEEPRVL